MPVSYTHLDVYKRQASARQKTPHAIGSVHNRLPVSYTHLQVNRLLKEKQRVTIALEGNAAAGKSTLAVSYTHLDVYKRQTYN